MKRPNSNKLRKNDEMRQNSKTKKPNTRSKVKHYKSPKEDEVVKAPTNDWKWYDTIPGLLTNAAKIGFSNVSGLPYSRDISLNVTTPLEEVVPGLMTFNVIPIIGDTTSNNGTNKNSALNVAAMNMYTEIRRILARNTTKYDASNVFCYVMSVAQIYSFINFAQRVYGLSNTANPLNRYLGRTLVEAQGVSYDDLKDNLADYRYRLNHFISQMKAFACPSGMTYFNRLAYLFSGIYAEGDSVKSQLYMMVPQAFLQFDEQNEDPGWQLKPSWFYMKGDEKVNGVATNLWTVKGLFNYAQQLLDSLLYSSDVGDISSDILTAYGEGGVLQLAPIEEGYTIIPSTDLTVLEQLQNADFISGEFFEEWLTNDSLALGLQENPDTNTITSFFDVTIANSKAVQLSELMGTIGTRDTHVLNTILTDPQPGDVIERTRFMTTIETISTTEDTIASFQTGSEIITGVNIWTLDPSTGSANYARLRSTYMVSSTPSSNWTWRMLKDHCSMETFKFHPTAYYFNTNANNLPIYVCAAIDLDNYTTLSQDRLKTMNEMALWSLFKVPQSRG